MGEYLVFLSKTTTQKVCPNKLEQEASLEELGIYNYKCFPRKRNIRN